MTTLKLVTFGDTAEVDETRYYAIVERVAGGEICLRDIETGTLWNRSLTKTVRNSQVLLVRDPSAQLLRTLTTDRGDTTIFGVVNVALPRARRRAR